MFFNLFNKIIDKEQKQFHECVILECEFSSMEEYGNISERESLSALEDILSECLQSIGEVDGHDIGDGMFTMYIYGNSADEVFEKISQILKKSDFDRFEVTLQYGEPQNHQTKEKHFTLS